MLFLAAAYRTSSSKNLLLVIGVAFVTLVINDRSAGWSFVRSVFIIASTPRLNKRNGHANMQRGGQKYYAYTLCKLKSSSAMRCLDYTECADALRFTSFNYRRLVCVEVYLIKRYRAAKGITLFRRH